MKGFPFFIICLLLIIISPNAYALTDHSVYLSIDSCLQCHPRALPTHKMQIPRRSPEYLPLNTGIMTCFTCHNCISGSCILRRSPEDLCKACHSCKKSKACILGVAHLGDSPKINDLIKTCTRKCHYGRSFGGQGEHKTNIFYIVREGFKEVTDRRVVLVNNKITCISCHDPYAVENDRLSVPYKDNALCLTCHIK